LRTVIFRAQSSLLNFRPGAPLNVTTVSISRAKDHLPKLVRQVQLGQAITLTRHGRPVARLVAISPLREVVSVKLEGDSDVALAFGELALLRQGVRLDIPVSQVIEAGRD
jgi:prevent-host-death family protein